MKLSNFAGLFRSDVLSLKSSNNPFDDYWLFDFDTGSSTRWEAGEHGLFSFPEKIEKKQMRPMSIASSPEENIVRIGTRMGDVPSAWKEKIKSMKPGEKIKIRGPFGPFKIQDTTSPVVMIAGGIGITPFRPMMQQIVDQKDRDIVLIYSSREEYLFQDEFDIMSENNERITIHYVEGREEVESLISEYAQKYSNDGYYYTSGVPAMIKGMKKQLTDSGVSKKRILSDSFQGY